MAHARLVMRHNAVVLDVRESFRFEVGARLAGRPGRAGKLITPHGVLETPAFIPVGTQAAVKGLLPEQLISLGAQGVLANAYHLYLRPGAQLVEQAGGLAALMGWPGPTFTDSGGFQVLSLGAGFKKVLAMDVSGMQNDDVIAPRSQRLAKIDDDGVTFRSHIDGSAHRFTPEVSMQVQHQLGADIIFAFDECTTLLNTRTYQEQSVERTAAWARRCLAEHQRLTAARQDKPYQALYAVVQGAQYEDLRRSAARDLAGLGDAQNCGSDQGQMPGFDGFGIGGALEKDRLGEIVTWVCQELPEDKPRHLLGISGIDDLFAGVAAGADTFDCVAPTRTARHGAAYTPDGPVNLTRAAQRNNFDKIDPTCDCYTCATYSRAYLHHLLRAGELTGMTLATIHNLRFVVRLVDQMRAAITAGCFDEFQSQTLSRYYSRA
jgi:queuine tRNA-ribosyltransferase